MAMLHMSCSACGNTITAADANALASGVRRHVESVCAAGRASPSFLAAVRRLVEVEAP